MKLFAVFVGVVLWRTSSIVKGRKCRDLSLSDVGNELLSENDVQMTMAIVSFVVF